MAQEPEKAAEETLKTLTLNEQKKGDEARRLAMSEIEQLKTHITRANKLTDSPYVLDETQPSHLAWHSLISHLAVAWAAKHNGPQPNRGTADRQKYEATLGLFNRLTATVVKDCPIETLKRVPDTGPLAGKTLLYYFAENDINVDSLINRLNIADLNWQHKENGNTALIVAASKGHLSVIRQLLPAGAAVEIRNFEVSIKHPKGKNAYDSIDGPADYARTLASILFYAERIFWLAEGRDGNYNPPKDITNISDFESALSKYCSNGACLSQRNQAGQTPYDVAVAKTTPSAEELEKLKVTHRQFLSKEAYQCWLRAGQVEADQTSSSNMLTFTAPQAVKKTDGDAESVMKKEDGTVEKPAVTKHTP